MNLVGQILQLSSIEAFTSRGTPITIGNNKDKYFIEDYFPPNSAADIKDGFYKVIYISDASAEKRPEYSFTIPANILESAIGENNE
jgi:hypothetical protein